MAKAQKVKKKQKKKKNIMQSTCIYLQKWKLTILRSHAVKKKRIQKLRKLSSAQGNALVTFGPLLLRPASVVSVTAADAQALLLLYIKQVQTFTAE